MTKNNVIKKNAIEESRILLLLFFTIALAEVIAEFFSDNFFIYFLKPMLIPILSIVYWKTSSEKNSYFLIAMFFAFLANIFFIAKDFNSILIGAIFFMFYRIIVIYLVLKIVKIKSYLPILLGSIPFIIIFMYVTCLTMNELEDWGLYIYIMQVVFMSFLGGFSVANYIVDDNKMNYWLLLSSILFTLIQLILILKIYYISISIFQPLSMILYVFAQYALYKFMLLSEESLDYNTSSC
jgi:hypothetical protein